MRPLQKILIVAANYYPKVTSNLVESAKNIIEEKSANLKISKIIVVPGVFEIPVIISLNINKFDAFIALGCVIKGRTLHFDLISQAVIKAIMDLSIKYKKPIGNGIITCLNMKQAIVRKKKGREAAQAVISVLSQSK